MEGGTKNSVCVSECEFNCNCSSVTLSFGLCLLSSNHPEQVDVMSGGKTCLQVAAHQGHINLVRYLLSVGANVNMVDKEGDSTLHYAAFGNQPEVMRVLLEHGADINILNVTHCSALHISAHKKPPHCVKVRFITTLGGRLKNSFFIILEKYTVRVLEFWNHA